MPFAMPIPRPFTDNALTNYAPQKGKGVYGLRDKQGWICVNEYSNLESELREILDKKVTLARTPTYFEFEACEDDLKRETRLKELKAELL